MAGPVSFGTPLSHPSAPDVRRHAHPGIDAKPGGALSGFQAEGVWNPVDLIIGTDGDDVEPTGRIDLEPLQVMHCCGGDTPLFDARHRFPWRAVSVGSAEADLDEDQELPLAHNEIDLASTTTIIVIDQLESLPLQVTGG